MRFSRLWTSFDPQYCHCGIHRAEKQGAQSSPNWGERVQTSAWQVRSTNHSYSMRWFFSHEWEEFEIWNKVSTMVIVYGKIVCFQYHKVLKGVKRAPDLAKATGTQEHPSRQQYDYKPWARLGLTEWRRYRKWICQWPSSNKVSPA